MSTTASPIRRMGTLVGGRLPGESNRPAPARSSRLLFAIPCLPRGSVEDVPDEPRLLHHSPSGDGDVRGSGDTDNAFKTMLLETETKCCQGAFRWAV
jgi:hypothetical protein